MTDKMPDETAQEIVDNPSAYTDTELRLANSYLGLLDIYLTADAANNEEVAALKAEHRADMAGLCDEIESIAVSSLKRRNGDNSEFFCRLNEIKQRISDE